MPGIIVKPKNRNIVEIYSAQLQVLSYHDSFTVNVNEH